VVSLIFLGETSSLIGMVFSFLLEKSELLSGSETTFSGAVFFDFGC